MTQLGVQYNFTAAPWRYEGQGGWYFISLPREMSLEIRTHFRGEEEGWGRLKAMARVGGTEWQTAIWFDTKHQTYLLPLKAAVRKAENLEAGETVACSIWI